MRASFIFKLIIVILAIIFIVIFAIMQGVCSSKTPTNGSDYIYCNAAASTAAVFEWLLGAIFCFYVLSFVADLYPAKYSSRHHIPHKASPMFKGPGRAKAAQTELANMQPAAPPPAAAFTHGSASPGYPSNVSAVDAADVVQPMAPGNARAGHGHGTTMV